MLFLLDNLWTSIIVCITLEHIITYLSPNLINNFKDFYYVNYNTTSGTVLERHLTTTTNIIKYSYNIVENIVYDKLCSNKIIHDDIVKRVYSISYRINNNVYNIPIIVDKKGKSFFIKAETKKHNKIIDITTEFKKWLGPNENFHGYNILTPSMLKYNNILLSYFNTELLDIDFYKFDKNQTIIINDSTKLNIEHNTFFDTDTDTDTDTKTETKVEDKVEEVKVEDKVEKVKVEDKVEDKVEEVKEEIKVEVKEEEFENEM